MAVPDKLNHSGKSFLRRSVATVFALALAACGGGNHGGMPDDSVGGDGGAPGAVPMGTLSVSLTDAPACGFSQVNVTVSAVRVHTSADASDNAQNWSEITLEPARQINLLDLQNGVLTELGSKQLPATTYGQIRLVLAENDGSAMLKNSVVLDGDTTATQIALNTPSAQQAGLSLKSSFSVDANRTTRVVLDFDACASIINAANAGNYILRPRLSLVPIAAAGKFEIAGELGVPGAGARVSAQTQGADGRPVVVKSTMADQQGVFVLSPLPPSATGGYSVVVAAPGVPVHLVTNVPVQAGELTSLPDIALPEPNPTTDVLVSGLVIAPVNEQANVSVRGLQTIGGVTVQMGLSQVDAQFGLYSLKLSSNNPRVAAYSASELAFVNGIDTTSVPYTLEAVVTGNESLNRQTPLTVGGPGGTEPMVVDFDLISSALQRSQ